MPTSNTAARPKPLTRQKVLALARKYLEPHQPADYRLEVNRDDVKKHDPFWYVVVEPSRADVRVYDYTARLVEAEMDLRQREGVDVLLVPVMPV